MNRQVKFGLKVITPLIMGGAKHRAELRTQSFNGVFRWWFRVAGGSLEDERRIFGWAGSFEKTRRGLVRLWFEGPKGPTAVLYPSERIESIQDLLKNMRQDLKYGGLKYLAFPMFLRGGERCAIIQNFTFTLVADFSPMASDEDIKKFMAATWLSFNLGNFGYRSRRGFGSLEVVEVQGDTKEFSFPLPQREMEDWIKDSLKIIKGENLLSRYDGDRPYLEGVYMANVRGSSPGVASKEW